MHSSRVKLCALAISLPLALLPKAINSSMVIDREFSGRWLVRSAVAGARGAYNHLAFLNRQYKIEHVVAITSSAVG